MQSVRDRHKELVKEIDGLNETVSDAMRKAEDEFLQAYRAHMTEVHREIEELKAQLDESQRGISKDDEIQELEKETAWYREESAQLTAHVASLQKQKEYADERLRSINADRRRLRKQVKAAWRKRGEEKHDAWLKTRLQNEPEAGDVRPASSLESFYWQCLEAVKDNKDLDLDALRRAGNLMFNHQTPETNYDDAAPAAALPPVVPLREEIEPVSPKEKKKRPPRADLSQNVLELDDLTLDYLNTSPDTTKLS